MKRIITLHLAIVATMLLAVFQPVFAENGNAPGAGCQVGANNIIVGEWQLFSREEFEDYLVDAFDYSPERAELQSEITYAFCDHNDDGYACVLEQNLPNDASGHSSYWLLEDNHPYGGK